MNIINELLAASDLITEARKNLVDDDGKEAPAHLALAVARIEKLLSHQRAKKAQWDSAVADTYFRPGATYEYKGQRYVTTKVVLMKDPASREWVRAVQYVREDDHAGFSYPFVREMRDFVSKFKQTGQAQASP